MKVVFDMDGTLFAGDSQLKFARRVLRRHPWRLLLMLPFIPALIAWGLRFISAELLKRIFLSYAWGFRREELERYGEAFAREELLPALYPELRQRWEAHLSAGDEVILCSASPEWWTRPLGEALGASLVIATPVEFVDGRLPLLPVIPPPGNNRKEAKVQRLAAAGMTRAQMGYTDSAADLPMMSLCERVVLVNPSPKLTRLLPDAEVIHTRNDINQ